MMDSGTMLVPLLRRATVTVSRPDMAASLTQAPVSPRLSIV